jgi:hypothetical protein
LEYIFSLARKYVGADKLKLITLVEINAAARAILQRDDKDPS